MLAWIDGGARELLLLACFGMVAIGLDDLAFDLLWLRHAAKDGWKPRSLASLGDAAAVRFAIFIPLWQEADVVAPMVDHSIARWGEGDYCLYLGCYPNDAATRAEAERLAARYPGRVRVALNSREGPTTKADNLNAIWRAMEADAARDGRGFNAVVLHDAEDVVHADELALYAALWPEHDMVQIPVVPLPDPYSPWVGGHYLDEFAEAHGKDMPLRDLLGAPIPSAGVGVMFRLDLLEKLAAQSGGVPFDAASVTEDYETGIKASALGARCAFVRVTGADGSLIVSRGLFPASLPQAVRQKARWILGIALAGWDRLAGVTPHSRSLRQRCINRWMWWRDRRAVLAAMLLLVSYVALALTLASYAGHKLLGVPVAAKLANPDILSLLLWITLGLLVWRAVLRFCFTLSVHGWAEAWRAVPRMVLSNIIAIMASSRALGAYLPLWRGKAPHWDKTDHRFPDATETGR